MLDIKMILNHLRKIRYLRQKTTPFMDGVQILSYPYSITSHSTLRHLADYTKVIPLIKQQMPARIYQ